MKNFINLHKKKLLIVLSVLLVLVIGITFSYFMIERASTVLSNSAVYTGDTGELKFFGGDDVVIYMTNQNLYEGASNLTYTSTSTVTLYNDSLLGTSYQEYSLNLYISENDYEYSDTVDLTPELIITIIDPSGAEVTEIEGLTYVNVDGVTGFDVTTKEGVFEIAEAYPITINGEESVSQEWTITLTVINLSVDQSANIGKTFVSNVSFNDFEFYLYEAILLDNEGTSYIKVKGTPDFSLSPTTNDGMYATTDSYGTSYYFRGAVDNNWVYFAGYYWRIVRIDGEGNVKLLYSGETAPTSSVMQTGSTTTIETSAFSSSTYYSYNVGYVYTTGTLHGSSTDSYAKTTVDTWFDTYMSDYTSYLAETLYCVDRTNYLSTGTTAALYDTYTASATQYFGGYIRLVSGTNPTLVCPSSEDELMLYAGLLSADEIVMAGMTSTANTSNYLYRAVDYWSLTPYYYYYGSSSSSRKSYVFYASSSGTRSVATSTSTYYLIPTISIDSKIPYSSGSGTYDDPYIIETDI